MRDHRLIHVLIKSSKFFIDLLGHCELFELPEPAIVLFEHFFDLVLDSKLPMMLNEVVESFGHVFISIRKDQVRPGVLLDGLIDVSGLLKVLILKLLVHHQ